jgi:hypothetical protein
MSNLFFMTNIQKIKLICIFSLFFSSTIYSQIGIGTNEPHVTSELHISSLSKGFLPPRLTTVQRNGIVSPATGLVIYNTSINCLESFNGTSWTNICGYTNAVPESPEILSITGTENQTIISFSTPYSELPITNYTVTVLPDNITFTGLTSPITVSGINPGASYTFYVTATSAIGTSKPSVLSNLITTIPSAPINFTPKPSNGKVDFSWTQVTGATGYKLEYKNLNSSTWTSLNSSTNSLSVTGLVNHVTYEFRVAAINNLGSSSFSKKVLSTPISGTILLYENFNQPYTSANWYEVNSFSVGITPTTGNILLEDNSLRVGLGGSTYNSTFMRTIQNLNRNSTDLVIQFDVKFTNCSNSFDGGEFFRYGPVTNNSNADRRFVMYKFDSNLWALSSYNVASPAGVNLAFPIYTCQTNYFYNVRVVLPAGGGMRVFRDGVQIWDISSTQMPNTFTGFPFSFVNTVNGSIYYLDNITISNN